MSSDSSSSVLAPPRASTAARCVSASPGRKVAHLGGVVVGAPPSRRARGPSGAALKAGAEALLPAKEAVAV